MVVEIWVIPHATLAKTLANVRSDFYARDLSAVALPSTVSFGVVQRLSARPRSLPLSLSAHVLVLSLSTVKVKQGDGGGR
jgi:hypothetical protein